MNKIFKVVWSKTKECYVVVSEVAKNNGGKKKVLASVLAGLAMVGVAAQMGTPVQADSRYNKSTIVVAPNGLSPAYSSGTYKGSENNDVSYNSIVVGFLNNAYDPSTNGHFIFGANNKATNESTLALGNNNEATGPSSTAIGSGSEASGRNTIAMGNVAKANQIGNLAIGSYAKAQTSGTFISTVTHAPEEKGYAVALGGYAEATEHSTVALGSVSKASGFKATAVGAGAQATNKQATAVGNASVASGENASAFGYNNKVTGDNSTALGTGNTIDGTQVAGAVAVGNKNKASGDRAIAIGEENESKKEDTITMGNKNTASIGGGIAIGKGNTADSTIGGGSANGNSQVAIGADNRAVDEDTIAIGRENNATERLAMAIGNRTEATGVGSVAIGSNGAPDGTGLVPKTISSGTFSVALGAQTKSTGTASVAVGGKSQATANSATAVGREANASAESATAVGYKATASIKDGVALGSQSKATIDKGVKGFNPAEDRTKQYTALAGNVQTSTLAAVSVGDGVNATRQITGLAAGKENTDAVNVAQLRSVNLKYAGDTGNGDVLLDNGTLTVKGEGLLSTSADTDGITLKLKEGGLITDTNGKVTAPTPNGAATTDNVAQAINRSGWNATASANGGTLSGTVKVQKVSPGDTVTFSSGTNLVVEQSKAGNQFTYSLNKDVDLTKDGSLTIGDTKINNAGMTITGGPSITKTGIDAGSKKITNVTAGTADTDAVNVKQLKDTEKHIKPGTYAVANDGSVTLKYVDGNGTEQTETAKITGIAKKAKVINGKNTTVEEGTDTTDNSVTYKVNVKGALADISSITNGTGSGKISFEGDQVVKVGGDHPISFDGKGGYVTGLQNKDWDITNPTVVSGRAATEDQLKKVSDGFNNTVKLTGNSGATGTQKLNQNGGLSFGVVGADNGKYITTTASGSNVVADLSTDAKNKLNSKVVVTGSGAATVAAPTVTTNPDGSTVTTYTVHVDPATATAASTESVVKKAVTGDTNIADVSVADGKATGDVGAKYEVSVSRNAVKDAAREAVTVNNGGTTTGGTYTADTNNPITVNPVKDDTNHNTTYEVKFDGNKAAKVIPLTYKANGNGAKTVTLEKGLDFTNGTNTTAVIDNDGVVKYNLNKDVDLSNTGSLTVGGTKVNNGGVTITAPTGGTTTDVKLTNTGLDNGGNKIINVAPGTLSSTSTDAVNGSQLYTVDQKFNNKINLGADGNTETTKLALDNAGGIKFNIKGDGSGASSANQYISTTASGSDIKVDLTQDAKDKLNKTYNVTSSNNSVAINTTTANGVTTFDLQVAPATGTTSTWDIKSSADTANGGATATGHETAAKTIANAKTVEMIAGKNLTVKQTSDTNGAKVEFALSDEIAVGKDGVNGIDGKIGVNGKDGASVVIDGKDGSIGLTGAPGTPGAPGASATLKVKDGVPGVDGAPGTNLTRIVYTDKNNVEHEVATHDDGMKFAGDDGQTNQATNANVIKKHLNNVVDIIGGATKADLTTNNIGVNNDGNGKLLVQLSKNLNGINTIKNGGTTITLNDTPGGTNNTPAVTISGGNLSMGDGTHNNKIVNVAPGTDDSDAVNYKQLKDAKTVLADGKNTKKSGTGTAADPYKVNVEGDLTEITSITNKADASGNAGKIAFSPNQTVTVNGDHNISLNGKTGDITGLTNTTLGGADFATKGRAATEEQLKIVNDKFNNKINLGADGNTETTKLALDNAGGIKFNIKGDGSGASSANQYISTTASGSDIKVDLTQDAKDKLNKTYNVTSSNNSVAINTTTANGVTTFDLQVAPATGTTSTWDIKSSADTANGGATATGHETAAKTIANAKTVEMIAGKNLTVKQTSDTNGAKVEFALSDEIAVGKDGVNGIDGKIGVNGKDGASVVIDGKDGSIGLTGAPGTPGAPGASATLKVKDGVPGVDGAPGTNLTRIVYTDKNNVEHEVATHDDGMKFAGDDGQTNQATNANVIKKHLNNVVDIIGGATKADLTTNNIGVNNDGNGKLLVQLSKNLNGINTIKNGGTTITLNDTPGGTNNTPAVTISGGNLSMGDGTHNNKIVNVAPGTDDSDAVNYKQLKDAKTVLADGKNTKKSGTGTAADPYKVNVEGDLTEITSITNKADASGNAGKIAFSPNQTVTVNGDHNISLNGKTGDITGLTNTTLGGADFATKGRAATEEQLKSVHDTLKANERHIAPTTVATGSTENKGGTANAGGTANVYKYDAASKTVTLTYNDGNGNAVTDTKAVIDLSNLSTGGTGASSWNVKSSANTTDGGAVDANHNANAQNIADGKSVEFQSGKNLVVKQTNDTANGNATVEFSLSDKITVGKDGANGKDGSVGAKGADGSAVVMNGADGSIGLNGTNGANGISIKGKDGANGVGIDGKDGVTRIVYTEKVPDPANPSTTKEVTHEVATMDDGLKFTGNNTGTVNKHKLGSLVKVQGEGVSAADEAAFVSASGNIAVTAENNDTLTIRLNKNLKGLNSIQLGGNTIQSNGDNITFTTNGGTTKTVATTDQLWTIQANGTDVPATNGKVNVVGKDGITVAKNAAGNLEISGAGLGTMNGFDVTANNGATSKTIDNGKKVDFNAGSNLTVKQTNDATGTHIEYALKEAVDLGTNGSLKAGDTTVNKDGVTIANGPSITKTGVDAGDKKITNVADGAVNATSKDAVNGSQLKKYTDAAKTTVEAGDDNVKVETDNSAADGHTNYKVSLKPVVEIGDTHKVKIDGHTGDITGLTNVDLTDPTFATKGRAATEEQLKQVLTEANKKAIEKVQAGTAAAGDTNIATVAPKAGDTFGTAGATYEVSVSKNAVKDAAKEAVKVTSASPAITVTPDTSVAHETTYKVGFDGNQAATQIPLTYKQNGGNTRTVKLSDGLNFIDGTNTKARTAADGKVTFDVMGDLTGITSISNAAGGPKMTFGGNSINVTGGNLDMGGKKITNLATGTAKDDAATVGQLTKVTSNNHSVVIHKTTDADGAPVYDLAVTGTPGAPAADPRVDMLGEEIGRVGAQGAALSALKPIQYDPLEPTQIMAGYGNYRGNSAVALGVAHYKNESTLIHGGVSWAGGSSHMMANAGVTWKVGNRDSEAAVADRYRKGPISSAYAMQQEMAAMKAQNAGLKGEVSDLKAENEQMKAQIAAMMAKLGL